MSSSSKPALVEKPAALWRIAFWIATAAVTVASLLPGASLPSLPDMSDKAEHALAYAALAALAGLGWRRQRTLIVCAFGLVMLGGVIEVAQGFVPGRFGELADVLANTGGVILGMAAFLMRGNRRRLA